MRTLNSTQTNGNTSILKSLRDKAEELKEEIRLMNERIALSQKVLTEEIVQHRKIVERMEEEFNEKMRQELESNNEMADSLTKLMKEEERIVAAIEILTLHKHDNIAKPVQPNPEIPQPQKASNEGVCSPFDKADELLNHFSKNYIKNPKNNAEYESNEKLFNEYNEKFFNESIKSFFDQVQATFGSVKEDATKSKNPIKPEDQDPRPRFWYVYL